MEVREGLMYIYSPTRSLTIFLYSISDFFRYSSPGMPSNKQPNEQINQETRAELVEDDRQEAVQKYFKNVTYTRR